MRLALLVALVALVACSTPDRGPKWRPAGSSSPRDGGTLRFASKDAIRTLDPTIAYDEVSIYAVHALFDTLVDYEPNGLGLVPRLADHWEVSPDQLELRFVLRDGIAYSDGTPLVAADLVYSLDRALTTPDSPFGPFLVAIAGAQEVLDGKRTDCAGITAPNAHELVIRLTHPDASFLYVLTMPFATPQRASHVSEAGTDLRRLPLGTGPFMLDHWDEGREIVLRRNPHYWDPHRIHLDAISQLENVARDNQFLMFERGELDTAERLSAPDYLWVIDQPAWKPYVHTITMMATGGSRFNTRVKPFDDRRVRQALNYALDKSHSLKLLNGTAVAAHGILPPGLLGRDDALAPYPHDPAKARALLAEAGFAGGLDLDYVALADEQGEKLAASLQADLAEVGVRLHVSLMSLVALGTTMGKPGGAPFTSDSWLGDYPDPSDFFEPRFHSRMIAEENSANTAFYANPELDTVLDAARAEPDPGKRATLYRRAEYILYDDAPWIWEYHPMLTEVTQPYVAGYAPHPVWLRDYTAAWLDVDADGRPVPR